MLRRASIVAASAAAILVCAFPVAAQDHPSTPSAPREPSGADGEQEPWWERLTFYGDLRGRYEGFFQDGRDSRQRGRYRLRLGMRTTIIEGLDVNLRLASGEASDVTSTNQSFDGFWNRKPINIDQASLAYTPRSARALTLGVGKFGYPMLRTQMVWDDDVNWEGVYQQITWELPALTLRAAAAQTVLDEMASGDDALMFGQAVQGVVPVGRHRVEVSVADYAFRNPDAIALALAEGVDIDTQQTNALRRDALGRVLGYQSGFNLVDVIARATFDTGRPAYPLTALVDYVINTRAAGGDDAGLWLSAEYGEASTAGTYAVGYTFARVERDAAVSAFNFSDMGPSTDVVMHMATGSYMPRDRVNVDVTAIFTRRLETPPSVANPVLTRIQVDARVRF